LQGRQGEQKIKLLTIPHGMKSEKKSFLSTSKAITYNLEVAALLDGSAALGTNLQK
jgi:hypothetical protein